MTVVEDTIPMEAAHSERTNGTRGGQVCEECDPPRPVKNLTQHRYRVHGNGRRPAPDRPPGGTPARARRPKSIRADMEITLAFFCQVFAMKDPVCGSVAMGQVPQIAAAWDNWAKSSPTVHRYLTWALSGGGAIGVVVAHLPVVLIVVQHHGPDRDRYFPPPVMNGAEPAAAEGAEPAGEPPWAGPGPVASGYAPASADRAR